MYQGYERASTETDDPRLESFFVEMASRSHRFTQELAALLQRRGTISTGATTEIGSAFHVWSGDRDRVLSSCEIGEDAALKAYHDALHTPAVALESPIRLVIEKQLRTLQLDHERMRALKEYVNKQTMDNTSHFATERRIRL